LDGEDCFVFCYHVIKLLLFFSMDYWESLLLTNLCCIILCMVQIIIIVWPQISSLFSLQLLGQMVLVETDLFVQRKHFQGA